MKQSKIAVIGAGSWGTAVAVHLASIGHHVMLWGRNAQQIKTMQQTHCNHHYLPDVLLPKTLTSTNDLNACIQSADEIIIAVPSHAFSDILHQLPKPKHGLSWLTKGLDPKSNQILSELVANRWGHDFPIAIISGPSFAREVAKGLPTALVLAGNNSSYLKLMHQLLHHKFLRVYESNDLVGVQWCGAIKNIIAIACGVSDGLNYGANAKAALITRGLAEMSRIGTYFGGRQETFMGLAGLGDLVLTCTDDQSRNRRFGLYIGRGTSCSEAVQLVGQVVEGNYNAAQVCAIAELHHIDMPICQQVLALLQEKITPEQAVTYLMTRPAKGE